jgi:hypothetical protein
LLEWLGFSVAALTVVELCQAVEAGGDIGVVVAKGVPDERLDFGILSMVIQKVSCSTQYG